MSTTSKEGTHCNVNVHCFYLRSQTGGEVKMAGCLQSEKNIVRPAWFFR